LSLWPIRFRGDYIALFGRGTCVSVLAYIITEYISFSFFDAPSCGNRSISSFSCISGGDDEGATVNAARNFYFGRTKSFAITASPACSAFVKTGICNQIFAYYGVRLLYAVSVGLGEGVTCCKLRLLCACREESCREEHN